MSEWGRLGHGVGRECRTLSPTMVLNKLAVNLVGFSSLVSIHFPRMQIERGVGHGGGKSGRSAGGMLWWKRRCYRCARNGMQSFVVEPSGNARHVCTV